MPPVLGALAHGLGLALRGGGHRLDCFFFARRFFTCGACAGRRRSLRRRGSAAKKAARRGPASPAARLRRCSFAAVFSAPARRAPRKAAVVLATRSLYFPAAQAVHTEDSAVAAIVPTVQGAHAAAPAAAAMRGSARCAKEPSGKSTKATSATSIENASRSCSARCRNSSANWTSETHPAIRAGRPLPSKISQVRTTPVPDRPSPLCQFGNLPRRPPVSEYEAG